MLRPAGDGEVSGYTTVRLSPHVEKDHVPRPASVTIGVLAAVLAHTAAHAGWGSLSVMAPLTRVAFIPLGHGTARAWSNTTRMTPETVHEPQVRWPSSVTVLSIEAAVMTKWGGRTRHTETISIVSECSRVADHHAAAAVIAMTCVPSIGILGGMSKDSIHGLVGVRGAQRHNGGSSGRDNGHCTMAGARSHTRGSAAREGAVAQRNATSHARWAGVAGKGGSASSHHGPRLHGGVGGCGVARCTGKKHYQQVREAA